MTNTTPPGERRGVSPPVLATATASVRRASPASARSSLTTITSATRKLPNRVLLHAIQKWGKTSFAAHAPSPVFLCTRGEDGLMTLIDSGELPPTPHFPDPLQTWADVKLAVSDLATQDHDFRTLILDTVNGAERLCHEDVCARRFENDWGPKAWLNFGAGPRAAVTEFSELLQLLDRCRDRGMSIILLAHSAPRTVNNPEGTDYTRWEPVLERPTWAALARWVDMVLFGGFEVHTTDTKRPDQKAKAKSQTRLIRTEPDGAWEAGNRHGLPPDIECGDTASEAWHNFIQALKREWN